MLDRNFSRRWLIVPALFLAFCSRGNSPSPTGPSGASAGLVTAAGVLGTSVAGDQGIVGASAAGDIKDGPIDINLVKVSQIDTVPEPDQQRVHYASAGGVYAVRTGLEVEIYVQIWTADPPIPEVLGPPRVIVDWGVGGGVNERDRIHCGPCRLSRTYNKEGLYIVTVTMDDRVGGTTKRTFTLDVQKLVQGPASGPAPAARSITQSLDTATSTVADSVSCGSRPTNVLRRFFLDTDHGLTSQFNIVSVDIRVSFASGGPQPIEIRLHSIPKALPLLFGNLTQIGIASMLIADTASDVPVNFPVAGSLVNPTTHDLVVDAFAAGGAAFFMGANPNGETRPSYIAAAGCGIPEPATLASQAFPNSAYVMVVNGTS